MAYQGGCCIQRPILHEICLQLEELRVLVLEHRLTLVVPFYCRPEDSPATERRRLRSPS